MKKVVIVTVSYFGTSLYLPSTYEDGKSWFSFFTSTGVPTENITWLAEDSTNPQVKGQPTKENIV